MAEASSISSSDTLASDVPTSVVVAPKVSESPEGVPPVQHRFPWALLLALLLVGAFEVFVRHSGRLQQVAFIRRDETSQLLAVRAEMDRHGAADIALVGSSQVREGFAMPELIEALKGRATIANYAVRGARMDVTDAVVLRLTESNPRPKLVVVGVSIRDFRVPAAAPGKSADDAEDLPDPVVTNDDSRSSVFLSPGQLVAWQRHRSPLEQYRGTRFLPETIRASVGRYWSTLCMRDRIRVETTNTLGHWIEQLTASTSRLSRVHEVFKTEPILEETAPLLGARSIQHLGTNGRRTLEKPAAPLERMFKGALPNYDNAGSPKPNAELFAHLKQLTQRLQREKIDVIWIEMPIAPPLQAQLSKKMQAEYEKSMTTLSADLGVEWIPQSKFNFTPALGDFCDLQHFNLRGAQKMTGTLLPLLQNRAIGAGGRQ